MNEINPIFSQKPTSNPYRHAFGLIVDRLLWDLGCESWRSRKKLRSCKDAYKNAKAVIVCNGPSLLKTNFALLDNVFCFGLNKINLLFEQKSFRPNVIVAVNSLVIEQTADYYNNTKIPLYLDSRGRQWIKSRSHVTFLHSSAQSKFTRDCSVSIQQGYTVTYVAMQLAFHMGFRDIALIGCDHSFATKGQANKTVVAPKSDENHFDPRYFSGDQKWQLPDLAGSEYYYSLARENYTSFGGRIINCTEGGLLEVFERKKLSSWLIE